MNNAGGRVNRESGLGLVSAIFVISILAILAAGMASMVANSAREHSQQLLSIRAKSAALSALDIQRVKMAESGDCVSDVEEIQFATQGLYECVATISCSAVTYQKQSFIHLISQASCGSLLDLSTRSVQKRILR